MNAMCAHRFVAIQNTMLLEVLLYAKRMKYNCTDWVDDEDDENYAANCMNLVQVMAVSALSLGTVMFRGRWSGL